jgi:hypothetical protein
MPGGFHPFHAGHAALYDSARRAFPGAEVYVAATNDTSTRPFPFQIKEKLAKLAGVEPGHFVQVKSPFQAKEITAQYNPEQDVLIFVRSEKDADKPPQAGGVKKDGNPAYLQPLLGAKKLEPFGKHAYMAYLPTVEFGPGMTSATEIRTAWPRLNEKRKTALVMSLYPKTQTNPKLAATVVKMLDTAMGSEELNEFAPDEGGGSRKFIPWPEFIEQLKQILHKDFSCKENIVKSTIKARFIPHDPMEYGPTMLYSYYETRAGGRNKGAISTRGSIQVGKYTKGGLFGQSPDQLLTGFHLLKGHPFERHFDLTFDNIYKIANIIQGNTEGALQFNPEIAEASALAGVDAQNFVGGMHASYQDRENQPVSEKKQSVVDPKLKKDPELYRSKLFAKQHYPSFSQDPEEAYDKWVQRSLQHSEEEDIKHNAAIKALSRKIADMERKIATVRENADYLPETRRRK